MHLHLHHHHVDQGDVSSGECRPVVVTPDCSASATANSSMGCAGDHPTTGNEEPATRGEHDPHLQAVVAAADPRQRALQLLELFGWMRASNIRPATVETLLALAVGASTPAEIRELTAHPAGTISTKEVPGLSTNGCWTALQTLLGQGQGFRNGKVLVPRCDELIGRQVDGHAGRSRCHRYGLTDAGTELLERLVGVKL